MKTCRLLVNALTILSLFSGYSFAQTTALVRNETVPLDTNVKVGKLPNGFTYYIRKNIEPKNRATLYLAVKAGSILETDEQQGLAHFMEHMGFNGTKNYPKNDLVNYLQKSGVRFGADLNAYTSFDETVYQLPIPTDNPELFKNGIQIMRDWAQEATLDPAEIDKERGVVLEEKRLGKGAGERMRNQYLPLQLNGSRFAQRLPIGTEEVLKNFKPETIRQFYSNWYRPDLQALIVVGDIDVKAIEEMIKAKFSDLKMPANAPVRAEYKIPLLNKNQFIVVTDPEMTATVAQILFKHPEMKVQTTDDFRASLIRSLYNQMSAARFSELSKQADPPFLQGGNSIGGFLAGLDVASSQVVAKPGELERGFKAVWKELEKIKRFGFTKTELDRAKQTFMAYYESAYKEKDKTESGNFADEYLRHFIDGEASPGIEYEFNFYKNRIGDVTVAEVNNLAKQYITDLNRDIIIMGPENDKAILPDEAKVNSWIQATLSENIIAYVDQVSNKPFLAQKPASGKVVKETEINEIGVKEWTLSNGVKVVLKPTDFKNDEISFYAYSPGGTSLYSDSDYQSAANASGIISRSGVGDYNSIELSKYLTGKRAAASPFISERFEGISGGASPNELETALQLTYLYLTQPRTDPEIFKGIIGQQKAGLANRSNDPSSVFADSVAALLGNYNIRRTGPSIQKLDQINLDKAYSIYKERFADISDFTFFFVGSFDPEKLKPLVEQYIGSLPATGRKEQARDLGITSPGGKVSKTIKKGKELTARVRLLFSGDYKYSVTDNIQMDALTEVLNIKLIERLREDEGGVYGVSASVSYTKYPKERYNLNISFGCAPENIEKLIASTLDEIKKIRDNGAVGTDIEKYVAEETRVTETQLKDNGFWTGYLIEGYQNNEDPKRLLSYLGSLKIVTPQTLKLVAEKYLNGDNLIRMVLLPEDK